MKDSKEITNTCVIQHLMFTISPDHLRFSVNAELHANNIFLSDEEVDSLIAERLGVTMQEVIDEQQKYLDQSIQLDA